MKNVDKLKIILMGLIIGILCGMFSAGGGLIAIPFFTSVMNFDEKKARTNTIFIILPMVVASAIVYRKFNLIDWKLGIKCGIGGAIGGFIGSKMLQKVNNKVLTVIFIAFLIFTGVRLLIQKWNANYKGRFEVELISGLVAGIFTGIGMGGGAILVMILTTFLKINQKLAQASNLIFFIPTSIVAIIFNLKNKNIELKKDASIIVFGVIGSIIGSLISAKLNTLILGKFFGAFLLAMAVYYIIKMIKAKKWDYLFCILLKKFEIINSDYMNK